MYPCVTGIKNTAGPFVASHVLDQCLSMKLPIRQTKALRPLSIITNGFSQKLQKFQAIINSQKPQIE